MHEQIICAGFGGQGIMIMGKLLAFVSMKEGYHVTWMPSYGAEVRGGTAHSMVHISTHPIAAPVIARPSTCIIMNNPSFQKFAGKIEKGGLLIVNSSMAKEIPLKKGTQIVKAPFTEMARDLGSVKAANMIAAGVFVRLKKIFSVNKILNGLDAVFPSDGRVMEINRKAVKLGYGLKSKIK